MEALKWYFGCEVHRIQSLIAWEIRGSRDEIQTLALEGEVRRWGVSPLIRAENPRESGFGQEEMSVGWASRGYSSWGALPHTHLRTCWPLPWACMIPPERILRDSWCPSKTHQERPRHPDFLLLPGAISLSWLVAISLLCSSLWSCASSPMPASHNPWPRTRRVTYFPWCPGHRSRARMTGWTSPSLLFVCPAPRPLPSQGLDPEDLQIKYVGNNDRNPTFFPQK